MLRTQVITILDKVLSWGPPVVVFLAPIFFLPIFPDWFELPKNILLTISGGLLFLSWLGKMVLEGKMEFTSSKTHRFVLFLGLTMFLASWFSMNRYISFINFITFITFIIWYFVIAGQVKTENDLKKYLWAIIGGAVVLNAIMLIQAGLRFLINFPLFSFLKGIPALWLNLSPAGSLFTAVLFSAVGFVMVLPILGQRGEKEGEEGGEGKVGEKTNIAAFAAALILALGLTLGSYNLYKAQPVFLPYLDSWQATANALGTNFKTALLGTGPNTLAEIFPRIKPMSLNMTPLWSVRFGATHSEILNLLVTGGLIVFLAYFLLFGHLSRVIRGNFVEQEFFSNPTLLSVILGILVVLISAIFLPLPNLLYFAFFVLLALAGQLLQIYRKPGVKEISVSNQSLMKGLFAMGTLAVLAIFYLTGRYALGEFNFNRALDFTNKNDGLATMKAYASALTINPYEPRYYAASAQTDLLIADNIISRVNENTSTAAAEADRTAVQQLVQQSIDKARFAVSLAPQNSGYWEVLTNIYRNLINFAQDAENWTTAAYQQTLTLDPTNPRLRFDLGSLYFMFKNYDLARDSFLAAVNLKPDYANAHYNLATTYRAMEKLPAAYLQLQQLSKLQLNDDDRKKINAEIDELAEKLGLNKTATPSAEATPSGSTPLTTTTPVLTKPATKSAQPKIVPPLKISTSSAEIATPSGF